MKEFKFRVECTCYEDTDEQVREMSVKANSMKEAKEMIVQTLINEGSYLEGMVVGGVMNGCEIKRI